MAARIDVWLPTNLRYKLRLLRVSAGLLMVLHTQPAQLGTQNEMLGGGYVRVYRQ